MRVLVPFSLRLPRIVVPRVYRQRWDWWLAATALLLLVVGAITVYSATHLPDNPRHGYFIRHFVNIFVGLMAFSLCLFVPLRLWEDWSFALYGVSIVFLLLVLVAGSENYGARRWFQMGPVVFQPSEVAKLALVGSLARFLAGKRIDLSRPAHLAIALAMIGLPTLLVLKQPDMGTAGAFPGLAMPMLIWAGIPWMTLFILVSPVVALILVHHWLAWGVFMAVSTVAFLRSRLSHLFLGIFLVAHLGLKIGAEHVIAQLEPYQKARIESFLDPTADPTGAGYQGLQSRIALGSGGAHGKGYLQGSQKALAYLPMQHNDFIFSVVGEEWGFLGCAVVLGLFGALVFRGLHVGRQCRNPFGSLLAVGIVGLIFYHAAVNIAMTMGLFPVTGLPLPFISYGGTFLLTMMAALGQLENVAVHRFEY